MLDYELIYLHDGGEAGTAATAFVAKIIRMLSCKSNYPQVLAEAAPRRYNSKYMFLKLLQYLQEHTCIGVSFQ